MCLGLLDLLLWWKPSGGNPTSHATTCWASRGRNWQCNMMSFPEHPSSDVIILQWHSSIPWPGKPRYISRYQIVSFPKQLVLAFIYLSEAGMFWRPQKVSPFGLQGELIQKCLYYRGMFSLELPIGFVTGPHGSYFAIMPTILSQNSKNCQQIQQDRESLNRDRELLITMTKFLRMAL